MVPRHSDQNVQRSDEAWEEAVRALVKRPIKVIPGSHRDVPKNARWVRSAEHSDVPAPLVELLALSGDSETPVTWGALMSLFAAALVRGDQTDPVPVEPRSYGSARSFREGARGTFYLDGLQFGVMPATKAERDIVFGTKRVDGQARRWSGLRLARAEGRAGRSVSDLLTSGTARNLGTKHQADCAEQLIVDLHAYVYARHSLAPVESDAARAEASHGWQHLASELSAALDVHRPPYPPHLPPSVLAEPLTVSHWWGLTSATIEEEESATAGGTPLREVLEDERRVVVVGPPGSGKSTLLIAEAVRASQEGRPALYVRLADVALDIEGKRLPTTCGETIDLLVRVAGRALGVSTRTHRKDLVRALSSDSRALIAMDGLDELDGATNANVRVLVRHLGRLGGAVLISSRKLGYLPPSGVWHEVDVDALPREYVRGFTDLWFAGGQGARRERALRAFDHPEIRNIANRPALLCIVTVVASEGDVPLDISLLYERYISVLLQRPWRPAEEQRRSAVDLSARTDVATALAWFAATGGTVYADDAEWVDSLSLFEVRAYSKKIDIAIAEDFLRNDIVLSAYGQSSSIIHQRYVWIHRTVHEYLIGAHLVRLRIESRREWRDQLLRMALRPEWWFEPLVHMVRMMSSEAQADLIHELLTLRDEGDPADSISALVFALAQLSPYGSEARLRLARELAEEQEWEVVRHIDVNTWDETYPLALLTGAEPLISGVVEYGDAPEWLPWVVEAAQRSPLVTTGNYVKLLSDYCAVNAEDALNRYIDVLHSGYENKLHAMFGLPPSRQAVYRLLKRSTSLNSASRLLLFDALSSCQVHLRSYAGVAEGAPDDVELQVGLLLYRDSSRPIELLQLDSVWQDIAAGEYGRLVAYNFGYDAGVEKYPLNENMVYAQIGRSVKMIRYEDFQVEPQISLEKAIAAVLQADEHTMADPTAILILVRSAHRILVNASSVDLATAVDLYRVSVSLDNLMSDDENTLERDVTGLLRSVALRVVGRHSRQERMRHLLSTSPTEWANDRFREFLDLEEFLREDVTQNVHALPLNDEERLDLVLWAAMSGRSALCHGMMRGFDEAVEPFVERLWQRNPEALKLAENSRQIANSLRGRGYLLRWRDRLARRTRRGSWALAPRSQRGRPPGEAERLGAWDARMTAALAQQNAAE